MKRVLLLISVLVLGIGMSACKKTTTEPDPDPDPDPTVTCTAPQVKVNGVCQDPVVDLGYDAEGTYITYFSGVDNMNPYSETLADSSTMYGYLTDGLYGEDYDWAKAIADGLATEEGDFTTSGAASLPYNRVPGMASEDPVDVNGDGTVWQITLRQDLEFEDGTPIDA
ncbi:MAG: hypothetical protein KJ847_06350, partial [Firmicutes bacterium]|nr:hypothetical protein [Bacillota bacterium]